MTAIAKNGGHSPNFTCSIACSEIKYDENINPPNNEDDSFHFYDKVYVKGGSYEDRYEPAHIGERAVIDFLDGTLQASALNAVTKAMIANKICGINFSKIFYRGQLFSHFFESLNANRNIRILQVHNVGWDKTTWQVFTDVLCKNKTISELDVGHSDKQSILKQSVVHHLVQILSNNQFLKKFRFVGFSNDDQMSALCSALTKHEKINTVELDSHHFSNENLCSFILLLAAGRLHSINLRFQSISELSIENLNNLGQAIKSNQDLENIQLVDAISELANHESVIAGFGQLPNLRRLQISADIIHLESIGKELGQNSSIQTLDINIKTMHGIGLQALGHFLSQNSSLQSLHISANSFHIQDDDLLIFSKGLVKHPTLSSLLLKSVNTDLSHVGDLGLYAIFSSLNTLMTTLEVFAPQATLEGMGNVVKLLEKHHAISDLTIRNLPGFQESMKKQLTPILERNKQLHKSLIDAFQKKDDQQSIELIEQVSAINAYDEPYLLHDAVRRGNLKFAQILINSPSGSSLMAQSVPYLVDEAVPLIMGPFDYPTLFSRSLTPLEIAGIMGHKELSDFLKTTQKRNLRALQLSTKRRASDFEEWEILRPYERKEAIQEIVKAKLAPQELDNLRQELQLQKLDSANLHQELQQKIQMAEQAAAAAIERHALETRKEQTLLELKQEINLTPERKKYFEDLRQRLDSLIHSLRSVDGGFTSATNANETTIDLGCNLTIGAVSLIEGIPGAAIPGTAVKIVVMFGGYIIKAINQMTIHRLAKNAVNLFPNSSTTGNLIEIIALLMTQRHHDAILHPPSISKMPLVNRLALHMKAKFNGYEMYTDLNYLAAQHLATFIELLSTLPPSLASKDVDLVQAILNGFDQNAPLDSKIIELLSA